jgi:hypothetical protein
MSPAAAESVANCAALRPGSASSGDSSGSARCAVASAPKWREIASQRRATARAVPEERSTAAI